MIEVILWMIGTLVLATIGVLIGKKYGSSLLIGMYTALVVMAQIFANKLVVFGNWVVPAGIIVYGVSFFITDTLSEFYSKEKAKKAIISGFIGSILLVFGIQVMIAWTPADFWQGQEALVETLGLTWRIVAASLVAYLISQFTDVNIFHAIKQKTKGKMLWLRNGVSTIVSQVIDSVIFVFLAFYGYMPLSAILGIIVGQIVIKLIIATMDTPFLYFIRWITKDSEWKDGDN